MDEMIAEFESRHIMDYEIRNLIGAYRNGFLDEDGIAWLREELEEALGGGINQ